jgi:hypothetical protein
MIKKIFYLIAALSLSASSIKAQTTAGTDFWLVFGQNGFWTGTLQIRIAGGDESTAGIIKFIELDESVVFSVAPQQVYTYDLTPTQRWAVYNADVGVSNHSIHITSDYPVTVYALDQVTASTDATNVLPITALGREYYQISYTPYGISPDAYAVVATEDNTQIYHDDIPITQTLNTGQVYYYHTPSYSDMTGAHITSDKPVAFFALCSGSLIPSPHSAKDNLFQQLAPVHTWGYNFFVPVSHLSVERVRIVAAKNGTNIDQVGGTLKTNVSGAQDHLNNLQSGEWVELEVLLSDNGCYIQSDKPIGVCTYLTGCSYNGSYPPVSDPAQAWLPSIEQTAPNALIAPFIAGSVINQHYAIVMTPFDTKDDTRVSIGGGAPVPLSGGYGWHHNSDADMSFYHLPLTDPNASYYFTNDAGLIVLCYGVGPAESYYYLAGSSMRNLSAAFSANGVPYTEMADTLFCVNEITFTTNISNIAEVDSMKWYKQKLSGNTPDLDYILITDIVEDPPVEWTRTFRAGNYMIKLEVYHNGETEPLVYEGELCVGAHITIYPTPNDGGMTKPTTGCYKVGTQLPMEAYPY